MEAITLFPEGYVASRVTGITVEVAVGIHPWERFPERPNLLSVDVEMFVPVEAVQPSAEGIVDYDPIRRLVKSWSGRGHVEYLETLAEEALAEVFRDARVKAARIRIMKRQIFPESEGAGIELFRRRA
ncbi:dihydroneopterin aldolase [Rhodovarius crocodyli]|nr:dihydroneopterin aldolase [Rhodovarius crocodyli]